MNYPSEHQCNTVVCITGDVDDFKIETEELLTSYFSILNKYGVKATFFITAKAAEDFPERVEYILKNNHIVEGHGDVHNAFYDSLPIQLDRLNAMKKTFSQLFNIEILGFRAPFYKHNSNTYLAIDKVGLKYDCSKKRFEIAFKGIPFVQRKYMYTRTYPFTRPFLKSIASLYNFIKKSPRKPYYITPNVMEFPTLGISDYSLIGDPRGPRFNPNDTIKITEIWIECLTSLLKKGGGVLTLQAHPGRMSPAYLSSLDCFIKRSLELGVAFSTPRNVLNL
jgi:peptidoglycan/xylan/chitin deacetylase (PgdA/CDA1 family)